jgi:hypothetical protein
MMAGSDAIKGTIAATVTTSGWGWITENVNMSTVGFIGSLVAAVACWLMLQKEKQAEAVRHKNTADALADLTVRIANLHVNDIVITDMISRFHQVPVSAPTEEKKS